MIQSHMDTEDCIDLCSSHLQQMHRRLISKHNHIIYSIAKDGYHNDNSKLTDLVFCIDKVMVTKYEISQSRPGQVEQMKQKKSSSYPNKHRPLRTQSHRR